ncbi:MAG: hypothetical protein KHW87_08165 [Clostridiales bacterium]|nr:hypothetical protein [Clostridiales bacterium]
METGKVLRYDKLIITCLLSFLVVFFFPVVSYALAQDEEKYVEASSFDEFTSSLNQIQSTGGTIFLTQDITVPAEESYVYINARYRKEVMIDTNGHTINVEGHLELWPFLTIRGDGSQKELFHVYPGGELRLVSISLDAGDNGIAVVQEEGSFLMYASEEDMGLPPFFCTGQIISSQTMTAAAYWRYNCEKLPIVRVPAGADFTADMLPDQVLSIVNRDHTEYEEEIPVVWDDTTFPAEYKRTLVRGEFVDGYSQYEDYVPQCLVVWESDTRPFYLNVYLESATQEYDMVFMYGESPQAGTIYIQSSDDGENWTDIAGTDGYAPVEVEESAGFSWILSYDLSDPAQQRPRYYRMLQLFDDGTELYSDALELTDDLIFTVADIDGGRGGETSPNEGENQLPNDTQNPEDGNQTSLPEFLEPSSKPSLQPELDIGLDDLEEPKDKTTEWEGHNGAENTEQSSNSTDPIAPASTSLPSDALTAVQPQEREEPVQEENLEENPQPANIDCEQLESAKTEEGNSGSTAAEKIAGIALVVCILAGSIAFFVFKSKR